MIWSYRLALNTDVNDNEQNILLSLMLCLNNVKICGNKTDKEVSHPSWYNPGKYIM